MKKLLILPLLVLLTGCVSYYYPETAFEDGVYYAEDDPAYAVYSGGYTTGVYYPWYSLDYFYLGYYPAPGYGFAYNYPSGLSIGFNYGFSPWYYPSHYYGYYSPWYGAYHHHNYYPAWRPYRGYYSRHHDDRYSKSHHRDQRYARNDRHDRDRRGDERYDRHDRNDRRNRSDDKNRRDDYPHDRYRSSSVRRYVSTAPGGQSGNRGMVVRNRDSAKVGKSRLHVNPSTTNKPVTAKTAPTRVVARPTYNSKRAGTEVRYRSKAKQTRSRTGPVSPAANSKGLTVGAAPINDGRRSNGSGARPVSPASMGRQAPVRAVSKPVTARHNQPKVNHSRNDTKPARQSQAPSKRSGSKQKSSRSDNHK